MPRRKSLSIEDRNTLERSAIELAKAQGWDRRGSMLMGFVEGYMTAAMTTPVTRKRSPKSAGEQLDLTKLPKKAKEPVNA